MSAGLKMEIILSYLRYCCFDKTKRDCCVDETKKIVMMMKLRRF